MIDLSVPSVKALDNHDVQEKIRTLASGGSLVSKSNLMLGRRSNLVSKEDFAATHSNYYTKLVFPRDSGIVGSQEEMFPAVPMVVMLVVRTIYNSVQRHLICSD